MKIKNEAQPWLYYFVGKLDGIAFFDRQHRRSGLWVLLFSGYRVLAGDQILLWSPPPVKRSSSEVKDHFRCWPPAEWSLARGPAPFANFGVRTKANVKRKKTVNVDVLTFAVWYHCLSLLTINFSDDFPSIIGSVSVLFESIKFSTSLN